MGVQPNLELRRTWPIKACSMCNAVQPIHPCQGRCQTCKNDLARKKYAESQEHRSRAIQNAKNQYSKNRDRRKAATSEWRRSTAKGQACRQADKVRRRGARKSLVAQGPEMSAWLGIVSNDPCVYCGAPFEQYEHVVPLSKGGEHGISNVVSSCASCNLSKRAKSLLEFLLEC